MHASHGVPVTVVRYFNVYGPRQSPIFVVSQSVHRVLNGLAPYLYDSGDQTRCFTYVDDAVRGTLLAAESDDAVGEAFNIGSMHETSISDVVHLTIDSAGLAGHLVPEPLDTGAHYGATYEDIPKRVPDTSKAERVLGWKLEVEVDEGIRRTVDWARANPWYLESSPSSAPSAP
jgi:UDP-glucose 4-epimerase